MGEVRLCLNCLWRLPTQALAKQVRMSATKEKEKEGWFSMRVEGRELCFANKVKNRIRCVCRAALTWLPATCSGVC